MPFIGPKILCIWIFVFITYIQLSKKPRTVRIFFMSLLGPSSFVEKGVEAFSGTVMGRFTFYCPGEG